MFRLAAIAVALGTLWSMAVGDSDGGGDYFYGTEGASLTISGTQQQAGHQHRYEPTAEQWRTLRPQRSFGAE